MRLWRYCKPRLEVITAAAKGNKGLEMAVAEYKKLTWSERRRMIAEEKEKARRDKIAMLDYAWNEGREKGEALGEARGQSMEREQILGLLDQGMSLEELKRRLSGEN
jgi:hypothetical protein